MRQEYTGSILEIRAIEDAIRASKKYTESLGTVFTGQPMQGESFQSRVLTRKYEVYPDVKVEWDMPAFIAWTMLWAESKIIIVKFHYDYRDNKAVMQINDRQDELTDMKKNIPGFAEALEKVTPITELVKPIMEKAVHETK